MSISIPRGHGGNIRGQTAAGQGIATGRFSRMFDGPGLDRPDFSSDPNDRTMLWELAAIMTGLTPPGDDLGKPIRGTAENPALDEADENPTIPAGYTYFGQFVDHDISFDPTPLAARRIDVDAIDDFRTPALDLDSVYGGGPDVQPYLYDTTGPWILLRTGDDLGMGTGGTLTTRDHLRLAADSKAKRIAVIGDKRNDENKIVAQIHTAFIALHNKVTHDDALLTAMGFGDLDTANGRFNAALNTVKWHYQWVVLNDFATRLCVPGRVNEVLNSGGTPRLGNYLAQNPEYAYLPFEFSVAAYRLGHSMVRPSYALNARVGGEPRFPLRIPVFDPKAADDMALNGFGSPIPQVWGIDWSFFLTGQTEPADEPGKAPLAIPQLSYRIDANLVIPLQDLPEFHDPSAVGEAQRASNLAYRNLLRGSLDNLPSGEAVAAALGLVPLTFDQLWWAGSAPHPTVNADIEEVADARLSFAQEHRARIEGRTPLWYYILREAEIQGTLRQQDPRDEFGGQHLGSVGSTIIAETFIGLLWLDKTSFLHSQRRFRPAIAQAGASFELGDLIRYALT